MYGFQQFGDQYWSCLAPVARGDLRKITGRVTFPQTFASTPDVWLRWAESDGTNTTVVNVTVVANGTHYRPGNFYNGFEKHSRILSVDGSGFTFEAYYWLVRYFNTWGSKWEPCKSRINLVSRLPIQPQVRLVPHLPRRMHQPTCASRTEELPRPCLAWSGTPVRAQM